MTGTKTYLLSYCLLFVNLAFVHTEKLTVGVGYADNMSENVNSYLCYVAMLSSATFM